MVFERKMTERLAETINNSFPLDYIPIEALKILLSSPHYLEQDHDPDFVLVLTEKQNDFYGRVSTFLDNLKLERTTNDQVLQKIVDSQLRSEGYEDFSIYVKAWEKFGGTKGLNEALSVLHDSCSYVGPTSLYALWTISHESDLSEEENGFLLETIKNWPVFDRADKHASQISEKFQKTYPKLVRGIHEIRRPKGFEALHLLKKNDEDQYDIYNTLSNVDHQLNIWQNRL